MIQVGSGLGQRESILSAIDDSWLLAGDESYNARIQFLPEAGRNLSHAFNLATSYAHGRYLLFFVENMEMTPRVGYAYPRGTNVLEYLVSVIEDNQGECNIITLVC